MTKVNHPPKHLVRAYLERRTHAPDDEPPLSPDEIRRMLDWHLVRDGDGQDQQ